MANPFTDYDNLDLGIIFKNLVYALTTFKGEWIYKCNPTQIKIQ